MALIRLYVGNPTKGNTDGIEVSALNPITTNAINPPEESQSITIGIRCDDGYLPNSDVFVQLFSNIGSGNVVDYTQIQLDTVSDGVVFLTGMNIYFEGSTEMLTVASFDKENKLIVLTSPATQLYTGKVMQFESLLWCLGIIKQDDTTITWNNYGEDMKFAKADITNVNNIFYAKAKSVEGELPQQDTLLAFGIYCSDVS